MLRVNAQQRAVAGIFGGQVFHDVGKDRGPWWRVDCALQIQQFGQYAAEAAGVTEKACVDCVLLAILGGDMQARRAGRAEIDSRNRFTKTDVGTLRGGLGRQDLVKIGTHHVPGPVPAVAVLFREIEVTALVAFDEAYAVFDLKRCGLDRFQQPSLVQELHALRQQAFANGKAREVAALDYRDPPTALAQQRGRGAARRTGANDGDIGLLWLCHVVYPRGRSVISAY